MSAWIVYWILMLDNIGDLATGISVVLGSCSIIAIVGLAVNYCCDDELELVRKLWKVTVIIVPVTLISFLPTTFLPTTKQAAVIYLLPKIAVCDTVTELEQVPHNFAKILNKKMNAWMKDIGIEEKIEENANNSNK